MPWKLNDSGEKNSKQKAEYTLKADDAIDKLILAYQTLAYDMNRMSLVAFEELLRACGLSQEKIQIRSCGRVSGHQRCTEPAYEYYRLGTSERYGCGR